LHSIPRDEDKALTVLYYGDKMVIPRNEETSVNRDEYPPRSYRNLLLNKSRLLNMKNNVANNAVKLIYIVIL